MKIQMPSGTGHCQPILPPLGEHLASLLAELSPKLSRRTLSKGPVPARRCRGDGSVDWWTDGESATLTSSFVARGRGGGPWRGRHGTASRRTEDDQALGASQCLPA